MRRRARRRQNIPKQPGFELLHPSLDLADVEENDADLEEMAPRDPSYSERLDVHRWSDHPEVNGFVDEIYSVLHDGGNERIRKKHLKVVLLDLYVRWTADPTLATAYSRNPNDYKSGTIYNELHISRTTIVIVDYLIEAGLVSQIKGFLDRNTSVGRLSRMWPTKNLVELFQRAAFSKFDVGFSEDRVPVILRDNMGEDTEFKFTPKIKKWVAELKDYNELLSQSFVSLANLAPTKRVAGDIEIPVWATQNRKFVHRVFNHSSFELGGRHYGGWWQNCPKADRNNILINDLPTSEIDYSSLHPAMMYAMSGKVIWEELGETDPYQIEDLSFEGNKADLRRLAKILILILINAEDRRAVPAAFRSTQASRSKFKSLKDVQVFEAIDAILARLPILENYICSGIGLELQFVDSEITRQLINEFTKTSIPILPVHDSYIVQVPFEEALELNMEKVFKDRFGEQFSVIMKYRDLPYNELDDALNYITNNFDYYDAPQKAVINAQAAEVLGKFKPKRSTTYLSEMNLFRGWLKMNGLPVFQINERYYPS